MSLASAAAVLANLDRTRYEPVPIRIEKDGRWALADRPPIPVEVPPTERTLPDSIAAAAYYVVSEAIANVVKHAHASSIEVDVSAPNGRVVVRVADDGVGGADPSAGSGLRGLADRVAVLDGRLEIESPLAGGTLVVAEIPLES